MGKRPEKERSLLAQITALLRRYGCRQHYTIRGSMQHTSKHTAKSSLLKPGSGDARDHGEKPTPRATKLFRLGRGILEAILTLFEVGKPSSDRRIGKPRIGLMNDAAEHKRRAGIRNNGRSSFQKYVFDSGLGTSEQQRSSKLLAFGPPRCHHLVPTFLFLQSITCTMGSE